MPMSALDRLLARFLEGVNYESRTGSDSELFAPNSPFVIDLADETFLDLFSLLNIFLLAELRATQGVVEVRLPGFGSNETPPLSPREYTIARSQGAEARALAGIEELFTRTERSMRLISFLNYFGFFLALANSRAEKRVGIPGVSPTLLESASHYRGIATSKSPRVLPLLPLNTRDAHQVFVNRRQVQEWVSSLDPRLGKLPLIRDGEFATLLGFELAENVVQHAFARDPHGFSTELHPGMSETETPEWSSLGAVAIRVLESTSDLRSHFPDEFEAILNPARASGVLEVVVGDRGIGLSGSLGPRVEEVRQENGLDTTDLHDIVAYALHPLGSRKKGGRLRPHALHRVANCVAKYGGVLRIRTNNQEFLYTAETIDQQLYDYSKPFGIYTDTSRPCICPLGMQMQVAIPLVPPPKARSLVSLASTTDLTIASGRKSKLVAAGAFNLADVLLTPRGQGNLANLVETLAMEPEDTYVVYDFESSGREWTVETFSAFIESQARVLDGHLCIGINLDPALAERVRLQELREDSGPGRPSHLLPNHSLLPVQDTDRRIHWFGLGPWQFDSALTDLLVTRQGRKGRQRSRSRVSTGEIVDRIFSENPRLDLNKSEVHRELIHFLRNNNLFRGVNPGSKKREASWIARLDQSMFVESLQRVVSTRLAEHLEDLGCFLPEEEFYRLPSSGHFSEGFLYTLPLLQDEGASDQICSWIGYALHELAPAPIEEILLVGLTAPVELLSLKLSQVIASPRIRYLNLGHFQHPNDIHISAAREWRIPAVLLSDVESSGDTREELERICLESGIQVLGSITLFKLASDSRPLRTFFWRNLPSVSEDDKEVPQFVLHEVAQRKSAEYSSVQGGADEGVQYLVEPFSLEPFRYSRLSREKFRENPSRRQVAYRKRLYDLESLGALRFGHWIFGEHHFQFTVSFEDIMASGWVAGQLVREVLDLCKDHPIDLVLLPLHSRIGSFVPRLQTAFRQMRGERFDPIYCVSTRSITERPFYLIPKRAKDIISASTSVQSGRNLNILILDDAIASGRSLFTLLRAIVLAARTNEAQKTDSNVPRVLYFSILDRQGQAQRTTISGMRALGLTGDRGLESEDFEHQQIEVQMKSWLDLEIPARGEHDCSACRENRLLERAKRELTLPRGHPIFNEIELRQMEVRPRSTEGRLFFEQQVSPLSKEVKVLDLPAQSVELGLWLFTGYQRQGYPFHKLLEVYVKLHSELDHNDSNDLRFLSEAGKVFFRDWRGLVGQWESQSWLDILRPHLLSGTLLGKHLLPEGGRALALGRNRGRSNQASPSDTGLKLLVELTMQRLVEGEVDRSLDTLARSNLTSGLQMFAVYYRSSIDEIEPHQADHLSETDLLAEIVDRVRRRTARSFDLSLSVRDVETVFLSSHQQHSFISHLLTVLNHTVRAKDRTHSRILASELQRLGAGEEIVSTPRAIVTQAVEFGHSFGVIRSKFPALFQGSGRREADYLQLNLDELVEVWSDSGTEEEGSILISEEMQSKAAIVASRFPVYIRNPILDALELVTVSLEEALGTIKLEVESLPNAEIVRLSIDKPKVLDGIYVLAPNRHTVESVLRNYILSPLERASSHTHPSVRVEVKAKSDAHQRAVVRLYISSNIQIAPEDWRGPERKSDLDFTRGITGFGGYSLNLFEISARPLDPGIIIEPDSMGGVVQIEFAQAFSPERRRNDVEG